MQCDVAGIATHHFNNKKPVMRIRCIPDLIYRLNRCVNGSVEADCKIGSCNVFINGTGQANAGNIKFVAEDLRTAETAITSQNHQSVYTTSFQVLICFLPTLEFHELLATSSLQYRATSLYDVGYTAALHWND